MKTVTPDSPLVEVIQKMNKFEIGSVVVVQRRRAVGIITERDIMRKIIEPWIDPAIIKALGRSCQLPPLQSGTMLLLKKPLK